MGSRDGAYRGDRANVALRHTLGLTSSPGANLLRGLPPHTHTPQYEASTIRVQHNINNRSSHHRSVILFVGVACCHGETPDLRADSGVTFECCWAEG